MDFTKIAELCFNNADGRNLFETFKKTSAKLTGEEKNKYIVSFVKEELLGLIGETIEAVKSLKDVNEFYYNEDDKNGIKAKKYLRKLLAKNDEEFIKEYEECIKDTFNDEMADVLIYTFTIMYLMMKTIDENIWVKMRYNSLRDKLPITNKTQEKTECKKVA